MKKGQKWRPGALDHWHGMIEHLLEEGRLTDEYYYCPECVDFHTSTTRIGRRHYRLRVTSAKWKALKDAAS